jgi:hypothetical protein
VITPAQAADYLDKALGVALPSFVVSAACDRVETVEPDMADAGYAEAEIELMQAMAVAIVACGGSTPKRVASQGAPSGASRSFKHADGLLSELRRRLQAMDTAGTLAAILGPDPAAATLLLVV